MTPQQSPDISPQKERLLNAISKMWELIRQLKPSNVREVSHHAELCNTLEEIENSSRIYNPDALKAVEREGEAIRWSTAFNSLIATESKRTSNETVDMVYSYRIAQTIEALRKGAPIPDTSPGAGNTVANPITRNRLWNTQCPKCFTHHQKGHYECMSCCCEYECRNGSK